MTRPELRPLTSVRGLFAWAVVLYHVRLSCTHWLPTGMIAVLAKGYLAVDFFFLLSGFVIWLNYGGRLRQPGATADFIVRRLARVWPLHAALLAFAAALAALLAMTGRPTPHFPLAQFPLHVAMMQDWGVVDALMWNDPAWSISAEWAAYLLVPMAAIAVPRRTLSTPLLLASISVPLLVLAVAMARQDGLGADISRFGLLRCLCEFSSGAMVSALWRRWRGDARIEVAAWAIGAGWLALWATGVAETLAVPFAFACLLLALAIGAERTRHPLSGRVVHWFGEASYATYLCHVLLFFAVKLVVVRDPTNVPPAIVAGYLLLVLAVSAALYHGLERPAQRAALAWWKRRRGAPEAVRPLRST